MPLRTLNHPNPPDSLLIFNAFRVDRTLPKHRDNPDRTRPPNTSKLNFLGTEVDDSERDEYADDLALRFAIQNIPITNTMDSLVMGGDSGPPKMRMPRRRGLWASIKSWFQRSTPDTLDDEEVEVVFTRIKARASELPVWRERQQALEDMLAQAKLGSQHDLVRRLEAEMGTMVLENLLYAKGLRRMLTEAQLLEFTAKCERGLCLDWVGNFIRPIPAEVLATKARYDEDHLFDNYVVLHFDPKNTGTSPEAQKKVKDPIMFGVLRGSRKLYFVGDWVDEQCNLTFQQIIDQLGQPLEIPEHPEPPK